jgi:hypothetical protein
MKTNFIVCLALMVAVALSFSASICQASILYVDGSIAASGAGTSWATAKKTIQETVTAAAQYDQVWVKAGTYALASTITLNKPLFLFGGFAGTETALSQRNLKTNVTTVDGQNARQCISITSDYVTVDGFSITRGYADGATQPFYGSGIFIKITSGGAYTTVTNCKVFSNTNVSAIYMYAFTGTISNCMVYGNSALYDGAGIYVHQSQSVIVNCTVVYNTATNGSGGGIYVLGSNYTPGAKIINTIVWSNTAGGDGANLYTVTSGTLSVTYSDIQGGYSGTGNRNVAPGFVSAGTYNYHLAPGASCCIDLGTNAATNINYSSVFPLTDFEGDPRIYGTYADIGADEYFVASAPTVTTATITEITTTTATGGGNVTTDGGSSVTARGVCWSTNANPTTADSKTTDGTGTGAFTSHLTGLTPNTPYHVRAYATNSTGTAYGSEEQFTTLVPAVLPTVSNAAITEITSTTASGGGEVTADGGATVSARGGCWSTSASPTLADSHTSDGSGTGQFSSSITGLTEATQYHVRTYATNTAGTAYGNDITFYSDAVLRVTILGDGDGSVQSIAFGIGCGSGTCTNDITYGETVELSHSLIGHTLFGGWSGDCTGIGLCTLAMNQSRTVFATFGINPAEAVWIDPGLNYYSKIGTAYLATGSTLNIKACRIEIPEDLDLNLGKTIILSGGYNSSYSDNSGLTTVKGTVMVSSGSLTVENLAIR